MQAWYRLSTRLFAAENLCWSFWFRVKWWMHDRYILSNFSRYITSCSYQGAARQVHLYPLPLLELLCHTTFRRGSSIYWPQKKTNPRWGSQSRKKRRKTDQFFSPLIPLISYSGDHNPPPFTEWNIITKLSVRLFDCLTLSYPDLPEIWVALLA